MLDCGEGFHARTVIPRSLEFPESEHHIGLVVLFVSFALRDRFGCELGRIQILEERFQVFSNVTLLCGHLTLDTPLSSSATSRATIPRQWVRSGSGHCS